MFVKIVPAPLTNIWIWYVTHISNGYYNIIDTNIFIYIIYLAAVL